MHFGLFWMINTLASTFRDASKLRMSGCRDYLLTIDNDKQGASDIAKNTANSWSLGWYIWISDLQIHRARNKNVVSG